MCLVPTKKQIQTKQDVYFLVSSIINRQIDGFTKEDILKIAKENIAGSSVQITDDVLNSIIDQEIDILYRNGFISISEKKFVNKIDYEYA